MGISKDVFIPSGSLNYLVVQSSDVQLTIRCFWMSKRERVRENGGDKVNVAQC